MDSSSPGDLDLGLTVRGFNAGQKVFRRYSLVRILGRGGMGVVWLARDDELEREVALKFLPELVLHDRTLLDNLKAETRRSLELTHRHIVRIYDFVQDQDAACISMEYIDGETLSHLRARKPNLVFDAPALQRYVAELCEALDYAHHRAKIVHRDIKPSNLMVNSRDEMKVADFGIARSLTDSVSMLTKSRHTSGTLLYMSPQQLDGERTSPLDDVYSVGAVLYELLTSKPPFYRAARSIIRSAPSRWCRSRNGAASWESKRRPCRQPGSEPSRPASRKILRIGRKASRKSRDLSRPGAWRRKNRPLFRRPRLPSPRPSRPTPLSVL